MVLIDCTWALREAKQDLFFMCLYIMDFFILFSSCAQLNMEWNTPYGVFQRNICSDTLSLAIFPSTQAILLNFLWHCPFYCNWMICMRREGGSVSLSFLSLKWKESYTSRTFVFWIPFYYLDISELMWAMAWEFPGARLQVFFSLYHLRFSSAKGFYYSLIRNLRSTIYLEQIDGVLNLVALQMYI